MIEFQRLCKSFNGKPALDNLTFSVSAGEIYGLLGPNGSGKTTSINILCNLLDPDSGRVAVSGEPVTDATKYRIGVAPQEISVHRDLTCSENLEYFAALYGLSKHRRRAAAEALMHDFGLEGYAGMPVSALSGGWQRRVNIAVALVHEPSILVLDEPTAALDVEARHSLWGLIEELNRRGTTILLTTHHLEEAERLCTRVGIIQNGRLLAEGTLDELFTQIDAGQLAVVEAADESAVVERADAMGWSYRRYGGRTVVWLPRVYSFKEFVDAFSGVPLLSVSLRPVGLEDAYIEVLNHQAN